MRHLDPDSVGIAALDEPLDQWSREHLDACSACGDEVTALQEVVVLARSGGPGRLEHPDPEVWDAVAQELGLAGTTTTAPHLQAVGTVDPVGRHAAPARHGASADPASGATPLRPGGSGRGRRTVPAWWLAAAAVVGIAVGGGVLWAVQSPDGGERTLASTELAPLPEFSGSGEAVLTETGDGLRRLDVTVSGAEPAGLREVWLLAPDATRMYSIGILDGGHGTFDVPDAIDLREFPVVDVSDEPLDGDPAHSGVSVVRGSIDAPDA